MYAGTSGLLRSWALCRYTVFKIFVFSPSKYTWNWKMIHTLYLCNVSPANKWLLPRYHTLQLGCTRNSYFLYFHIFRIPYESPKNVDQTEQFINKFFYCFLLYRGKLGKTLKYKPNSVCANARNFAKFRRTPQNFT
jgi:hypothetical protein